MVVVADDRRGRRGRGAGRVPDRLAAVGGGGVSRGRPRHGAEPAADAVAALRDATREAHEAIKALREVIRDGKAERDALARRLEAAVEHEVKSNLGDLKLAVDKTVSGYTKTLVGLLQESREHVAQMLGAQSADEIVRVIVEECARSMRDLAAQLAADQPGMTPTEMTGWLGRVRAERADQPDDDLLARGYTRYRADGPMA
jgi:hypothetical protein